MSYEGISTGPWKYYQGKADALIKTGPGVVHSITISQDDVAPTAGSITLADEVTETTPLIFKEYITTGVFSAHTCILDVEFSTGLYLGFTTTADVNVTVAYR